MGALFQVSEVTAMLTCSLCTSRRWPQCQRVVEANSQTAHNPLFNTSSPDLRKGTGGNVVPPVFLRSGVLIITGSCLKFTFYGMRREKS
jgi:hypothetical protein